MRPMFGRVVTRQLVDEEAKPDGCEVDGSCIAGKEAMSEVIIVVSWLLHLDVSMLRLVGVFLRLVGWSLWTTSSGGKDGSENGRVKENRKAMARQDKMVC